MDCSTEARFNVPPSNGCRISASGEQIDGQANGTNTYTPIVDDHYGGHNRVSGASWFDSYDGEKDKTMPIAIIGMSCRFPGDATNPEKLWELCTQAQDAWSEFPADRFNASAFYHPNIERNGVMNIQGGYFIKQDLSRFDAQFFNISANEAKAMDPQQRIQLECAYEALENAGIPMENLSGSNTSVFTASFTKDYMEMLERDPESGPLYQIIGNAQSIMANRISYFFNLNGPSIAVDTACSASLVALHLACQSLRCSESKQAIVGGANLIFSPDMMIKMTPMRFFSPDGKCYTFDDRAKGYARGEGVACVILKSLEDAIRDGDQVRALIRGSGVNQDGRTAGITLPSCKAQESLIRSTYLGAGLDPLDTGYVEGHGAGTSAGDPIEAAAIASVFGPGRSGEKPLRIGSIKTNVGHLEGASGLAGVIKAVMILEKGLIPPSLNFETANSRIPLEEWKLKVPLHLEPWPFDGPRRVSVNSFGFGGTNAHIIMEDSYHYLSSHNLKGSPQPAPRLAGATLDIPVPERNGRSRVFVMTSNDQNSCELLVRNFTDYLQEHSVSQPDNWLIDLAHTLGRRRSVLPWKVAVCANSALDLLEALQGRIKPIRSSQVPRLGFVFTGQGAQWHAMGRELIDAYPIFKSTLAAAEKHLKSLGATWSIFDELSQDAQSTRVNIASISQPLSTAIQIALVDLLSSWGVKPTAVVGHSSGEAAASYAASALTMESAMSISYFKGLLTMTMEEKAPHLQGAMMAVGLSQEDTEAHISTITSGQIVVACINSPLSVTVSGDASAIDELQTRLESEGIFVQKLKIGTAYHSYHMQTIADDYLMALSELITNPSTIIGYWSSVTGGLTESTELDGPYWVRHMVSPVRFSEALRNLCLEPKGSGQNRLGWSKAAVDLLVEIGPHSALAGPIKQILATSELENAGIVYAPTLVRNRDAVQAALQLACTLFANGYPVNLDAVNFPHGDEPRRVIIDLPRYPWNHSISYWHESRLSLSYRFRRHPRHDLLGAPVRDFNDLEPKWRNIIRVSDVPWLKDHRIQSSILYPAAGFIAMAIEAIIQSKSLQDKLVTGYRLRDVSLSKALVVPETPEGVETSTALRPFTDNSLGSSSTWQEFRIFSHNKQEGWSEHCRGIISPQIDLQFTEVDGGREATEEEASNRLRFENAVAICKEHVDVGKMYESLETIGVQFGSTFRNLDRIQAGPNQALCTVSIPDTGSIMPHHFEYPHLVHPATLDAVIQAIFPVLTGGNAQLQDPVLPTFIRKFFISRDINKSPGHRFLVHASTSHKGSREVEATIAVADASGPNSTPIVEIEGLKCVYLGKNEPVEKHKEARRLCFKLCWEPDVDSIKRQTATRLWSAAQDSADSAMISNLELASVYYIQDALEVLTDADYLCMEQHHQLFYSWMKRQYKLAMEGGLEHVTIPELTAALERKKETLSLAQASSVDGQLLRRVGGSLARILRKEIQPLTLMLEDDLLYEFYGKAIGADRYSFQVAGYIDKLAYKRPNMNIIEIGAGTGGGTLPILQVMGGVSGKEARFSHYDFTDISSGFFEKAQDKFSEWGKLISFKKLNIECDPAMQGFKYGTYDLVIAANVLHATSSMDNTMKNVRKLLKPNGKLILLEITHVLLRASVIFGTLPGWWLGTEDSRKTGPTLSEDKWETLLKRHGFTGLDICVWDYPSERDHLSSLIVSTATDGHEPRYPAVTIVHDGSPVGVSLDVLRSSLANLTGEPTMVTPLEDTPADGRVCIFLGELHEPLLNHPQPVQFASIKRIFSTAKGVLWISRGGAVLCERPDVSLITGLARTVRCEGQASKFVTLDLDAQNPLGEKAAAQTILDIFRSTFDLNVEGQICDVEFAERNGAILIPRVLEDTCMNESVRAATTQPKAEMEPFNQPNRFLRLEIEKPGLLDTLRFVDNPAMALPLPDDEVEIETRACGLNFHDIMICMGQIADGPLGCECSGIVTQLGKNVTDLTVGDRVCAWAGSAYSNSLRTHGAMTQRIPDEMTFEVAASIPVAYCTAYISLHDTARLQKGETVLIHGAAGGVGQAAIALSRLIGAEIFVTVSTAKKKKFLMEQYAIPGDHIFSSRDTSFARGIMRMTNNKGVDVILNSLAGEALRQTWYCVAMFGRFVEIGKRDMVVNSRLDMAPFLRHVTFASVDLEAIFYHRISHGARTLSKIIDMFRRKQLDPITPITIFSMSEIEAAFRLMQAGKHTGKIVVTPKPEDQVKVISRTVIQSYFHSDASYLLVGGLGGLGREIARWLMQHGARNIISLSRSGLDKEGARQTLRELEEGGVNVFINNCDVSNEAQLAKSLEESMRRMPVIRGVIQGAMVLKDTLFEKMSAEDYKQVILPKVQGSWNLHEQLSKLKLDFFVMLASAVSVSGNLGQSNYAAASSFQDALSHYRAAKGLPAVTIDLGVIFGAGFVSENEGARANLKRQGYADIHLEELMAILQSATTRSAGDQACQIITGLYTRDILDSKLGQSLSDSDIPLWFRDLKFSHLLSKSAVKIGESTDTSVRFHLSMERAKTLTEASEVVCEAIMAKLSKYLVIPKDNIHSDRPIVAYGIDSLVAVELRNWMLREIKADIPLFEILGNTPLLVLSRKVATKSKLLRAALLDEDTTQSNSGNSAEESRVQKMQALVEKYSKDLPLARHSPVRDDRWTVILTGSTGSLGSHLLESLLVHPKVVKVICLNRSARGQQGQADINAVRGLTTDLAADRVEFYQVDLGERQLALAPDKYGMLLSSVTHIIHNAWQVDFISSIESFEHSHIRGVRHLIEFSVASKKTAGIYFVSSASSVTNWLERHSGNVPEKIIRDYSVASPLGYCESKHVAERLLDLAGARCGVPVTVIRVCQVAGPIQKQGMWNKREWLPSLISSSKYLGLLPETLGAFDTVNWIPVDFVSEILIGLVESSDIKPPVTARVYHIVNPRTTSWKSLLPTVQAYFNQKQTNIEIVPFTVWVGALQASALAASANAMKNPALSLLEVYQLQSTAGLAEIARLEVQQTVAASTSLEALEAVGAQWMTIWLQQWDF